MGLDMYLERMDQVGYTLEEMIGFREKLAGDRNADVPQEVLDTKKFGFYFNNPDSRIYESLGLWRDIYHIHGWFVQHVQNGVDDGKAYLVSKEQLEALLKDVTKVLALRESVSKQVFGVEDPGKFFYQDLEHTKENLEGALETTDFSQQFLYYEGS